MLSTTTRTLRRPVLLTSTATTTTLLSSFKAPTTPPASTYNTSASHFTPFSKAQKMASAASFYDLAAPTPKGSFSMADLKGKVVMVVNVASKCGFTPQYEGLEALYKKYQDQGFTIIGFPCNQFGSQESGTDEEIGSFCKLNFGVSFPIMAKSDVNGDNTNEVFKYLKSQKGGLMGLTRIPWNFSKFIINRKGEVVSRYAAITKPESLEKEIETLLAQSA